MIIKLIFLSVAASLCGLLAEGYEKYIKYIGALICASVILFPLLESDIPQSLSDYSFSEASAAEARPTPTPAEALAVENAEGYIEEIVFGEFGIKPHRVCIVMDWSQTDALITEITVAVPGEASALLGEIKAFLTRTLGGEVNVIEA